MKRLIRIPYCCSQHLHFFSLPAVFPFQFRDQGLVIGQFYRLESGKTLNNDLTVIGGNATLMQDSTVNGGRSRHWRECHHRWKSKRRCIRDRRRCLPD